MKKLGIAIMVVSGLSLALFTVAFTLMALNFDAVEGALEQVANDELLPGSDMSEVYRWDAERQAAEQAPLLLIAVGFRILSDAAMLGGGIAALLASYRKKAVGNLVGWSVLGCALAGLSGSLVRLGLYIALLLKAKERSEARRYGY